MVLLLDTHALIWFVNGDQRLTKKAISLISDINNQCFISIASIWEIAIKISIGKLILNGTFDQFIDLISKNEIDILPIEIEHLKTLLTLNFLHRDPFDRIIISQALAENHTIISKDENFAKYNVNLVWD